MRVRSWLIRGLILVGVAALAALAWVANSWISPDRVREKVVGTLSEQFEGVDVHVGSARMRILGGIAVTDLRLTRRGDPPDRPFLSVPNAILYHDKEQLNRGVLTIKKVEMDGPVLRIERFADGKWNVAEVTKPPTTADKPVPTFVVKNGTVEVIDRTPGALPPVTLTDVQLTLLNDPLPTLTVQASAAAKGYGPVNVRGRLNRINNHLSLSAEMAEVPLDTAAVPAAQRFAPELAVHLAKLKAVASIKADVTYAPDMVPQWHHDVRFEVKDARFEHPELPWPIEKITATVRSIDGRVKVEDATAQVGAAKVKVSLETRTDVANMGAQPTERREARPTEQDPFTRVEDAVQRIEVTAFGIALDNSLFDRLPDKIKRGREMFSPTGNVDLGYKFTREGTGWRREIEVRPKQSTMTYEKFRYPVSDVRGVVKRTITNAGNPVTTVDLVGTASGQPVTVKGRIEGDGDDPAISLRVVAQNVPLDEKLYSALPPKSAALVRQFRASGRGELFVAEITQAAGVNLTENEFRIDVKDGTLNYTKFPYPLEQMKGRLVIRTSATDPTRPFRPGEPIRPLPDRDEIVFDGFNAVHAGALLSVHGSKRPLPDGPDRKLVLHVSGTNVPFDDELKSALAVAKMDSFWGTLAPKGKITFTADVDVLDRAAAPGQPEIPIDPERDVKLVARFSGPTVTPKFFAYEMADLNGRLEYKDSRLVVSELAAKHGQSKIKLGAGEVRFYPDGAVWANLGGIEVKPLVADAALKKALPGSLGSSLDDLQFKGGAELVVKHMVVLAPPDQPGGGRPPAVLPVSATSPAVEGNRVPTPAARPDPIVYWDAEVKLFGASLDTGVVWEDAYGSIACRGRYEGTHVGAVRGNVWLDKAIVSRMPVAAARCQISAEPQQPDPARPGQFLPTTLQFLQVTGDLFKGTLGGQAHVVLTDPTRFEVWLTVIDANLEEVARHYKLSADADLKGVAQAQLLIYNRPDPKTGKLAVEGSGKIDVPTGRMYNLPIMLELVKVLKLQAPDKTAFEQAHAVFRIQGDRIKVDQLDLIGKAICVGGSGELDLTGDYVKFEFYTVLSTVLKQMRDTPVGAVTEFVSKNLFTIKMTRENGELKYRPEPVPLVTEPTKAVIERLRRAGAKVIGTASK